MAAALSVLVAGAIGAWWLLAGQLAEVRVSPAVEQAAAPGSATVLNASGYVTARRRATVSSKITGRLVEVRVEEGLPVREGQVLARVEDSQHRAGVALAESRLESARRAIKQTEARLDLARLTRERSERLVQAGVVDRERLDRDETEVATLESRLAVDRQEVIVAEREVSLQQTGLDDTVIRAPFDGVVISKDAQPGEMVSPNSAGGGFTRTGICTLVDMRSLEIEVDVNESYISRVRPGQLVEATLDAYSDWRIPAKVITTIPSADRQKATVLVRIGFDELDPRILPDMGIKVAFREPDTVAARQILIPRAALRQEQGRDVVYLVAAGRIERRAITAGAGTTDDQVIVAAGLSAGELVVIEGPSQLSDGERVTLR